MLNFLNTRFNSTRQNDVLDGHMIQDEGAVLAAVRHQGTTKFRLSTGEAGEVFGGFSKDRTLAPQVLTKIEERTVDADGLFKLNRATVPGQLALFIGDKLITNIILDEDLAEPADADSATFDGTTYRLLKSSYANKSLKASYLYEPTIQEAITAQGTGHTNNPFTAGNVMQTVGRIVGGIVSTDMYDVAADWSDDSIKHPSMGMGGRLTLGGNGTVITELLIMEAPVAGKEFVTVEYTKG